MDRASPRTVTIRLCQAPKNSKNFIKTNSLIHLVFDAHDDVDDDDGDYVDNNAIKCFFLLFIQILSKMSSVQNKHDIFFYFDPLVPIRRLSMGKSLSLWKPELVSLPMAQLLHLLSSKYVKINNGPEGKKSCRSIGFRWRFQRIPTQYSDYFQEALIMLQI